MLGGEELRNHLKKKGYEYMDAVRSKEGLVQYLFECHNSSYRGNSRSQQQDSVNASRVSNASASAPTMQSSDIKIEQKSALDFWDIMLLSYLWGRGGNTTNIHNYFPDINRRNSESDGRVFGSCVAVFCLIFVTVMSYFLLAYAAYKIKNAKLESNKYSIPIAISLVIFSFSVSATLVLLLSGMVVPNLGRAMRISSESFTGFQLIIGLNAVIFGLGAVLFCYLAIDKANKRSLVDKEVDRIINDKMYSPDYGVSSSQHTRQQLHQHKQYQGKRYQSEPDHHPLPSAPPPCTEHEKQMYDDQPGFDTPYCNCNPFQKDPQPYFNNPDIAQYSLSKALHPS